MYNTYENRIVGEPDDYNEYFKDVKVQKEAFQIALDIRKFEIELYWKRATYFWIFIGATFVVYFQILTSNSEIILQNKYITILISVIGYFLSLGWYFVNRGSKYWQENWERHVSNIGILMENQIISIISRPDGSFMKLTSGYPFSVSRVNHLLNIVIIAAWIILSVSLIFFSFQSTIFRCWGTLVLCFFYCFFHCYFS